MADPLSGTAKVEHVVPATQSRFTASTPKNPTSSGFNIGSSSSSSSSSTTSTSTNPTGANAAAPAGAAAAGGSSASASASTMTPNLRSRLPSQRRTPGGEEKGGGGGGIPGGGSSSGGGVEEEVEGWKPASKNQAIDMDTLRLKINKGFEVQVGKRTVIEPNVTIIAEGGSIIIGADNIISEGTCIINKSDKGEAIQIGNGNLFEPNSRIEASKIGAFNVFGAKCHVKQGVVIGNGCVIGPRVMVIQNTRIRQDIVVFGDNMMHEQPLMTKRNRAYIHQMVIMLNKTWMEQKQAADAASGQAKRGLPSRSQTDRAERGDAPITPSRPQGQTTDPRTMGATTASAGGSSAALASQSQTTPRAPLTNRGNFPSGSRAETSINKSPSPNPQPGTG